jgi:hypothetical protein
MFKKTALFVGRKNCEKMANAPPFSVTTVATVGAVALVSFAQMRHALQRSICKANKLTNSLQSNIIALHGLSAAGSTSYP